MPELPEVETVVRDLRPLLHGRPITAVSSGERALRFRWRPEWADLIIGQSIQGIRRRGKWIIFDLEGGARLLAHLGMTGQFRVLSSKIPHEPHTHLIFSLNDELELRFRDARRFGGVRWVRNESEIANLMRDKLGPEPSELKPDEWFHSVRRSRRALKAILLDQAVVAGVGNIYADESLFLAKLSPEQRGTRTTRAQAERLRLAVVRVLELAIASRGSTIRNYVGGSGLKGQYQQSLLVYGRTSQPCPKCRSLIQCIRLAGRSTHYCPRCQKSAPRRAGK